MILVIRARTTVDHKEEALVAEDTTVVEEMVVEEDMETEEVRVATMEEEALDTGARGEMNGNMEMAVTQGKELVEEAGVEVPVVAEVHQEEDGVVVQVGPKILLLSSHHCTRSNF